MGKGHSKLEKHLESLPDDNERYFGLDNLGQTCYMNSVLQALYFCIPFRVAVLGQTHEKGDDSLLRALADLFQKINSNKRKSGSIRPSKFFARLHRENCLFGRHEQQDAQEFLSYLLNSISESLKKNQTKGTKRNNNNNTTNNNNNNNNNNNPTTAEPSWVDGLFGGKLSSETRCLMCETLKTRDDESMVLSLKIDQNTSITSCLKSFSAAQFLKRDNKFFCETCCSYQEATTRMRIKSLPKVLAIQLNRFAFKSDARKLSYRVVYPLELRVFNTTDDVVNGNILYHLAAVVVHVGSRIGCGHYVCVVKSGNLWLRYDDDFVEPVSERYLDELFGITQTQQAAQTKSQARNSDTAYILMYVACDVAAGTVTLV